MHREISHVDEAFHAESHVGLFALTGLIGLLIGADLGWTPLAEWLNRQWVWSLSTFADGVPIPLLNIKLSFSMIAAVVGGSRILYLSLEGLVAGRLGADLALAIAVVAAILINQKDEARTRTDLVAAEIVFIGLLGECLEAFTFARTQRAIRKLVEVSPHRCVVLRDGQEIITRVEDVRAGERVLVRPGKRVPVDGVVVEGRSAVDQSTLTGESLPVEKAEGSDVFAGTLNQHGALTIETKRVAEHTVMGRVVELTARALKDKAGIERTADRLARYFLPAVLGIALATLLFNLWWFKGRPDALYQAVFPALAVLVVACPCALILATPAAVIAALGRLAGTGVLIKGGAALERLAKVDAFAFDKTGTLTEGRLQLGEIIPLPGADGLPMVGVDELLRTAAIAEQKSEHLLAQLIVAEAHNRQLPLSEVMSFQAHPGGGVTAEVEGGTVRVGNQRFLESENVPVPETALVVLEQLDAVGQTSLLIARDAQVLGVIGVRDGVRPEAVAVVRELGEIGISRIAVLTGDRMAAARAVAEQVSIAEVHAELLPAQKAELLERWKAEGLAVAMVGDGINDAPALARANVGIALGGVGSDVAAEAGDFVLMGEPLRPLPFLVRLSRKTLEVIRQNIVWFAFAVNAIGIVLTAWIPSVWSDTARHQSPIWAAIYHQIGSVAVLLNAMRLLWFERAGDFAIVRGAQNASRRLDSWLERLSFHEFSHWVENHWRKLLGGLGLLLFLLFLTSGIVTIRPDEIGIVKRFGRPLPSDLRPGIHLRMPWPLETVTKIQPNLIRSVEVGYRNVGGTATASGTLTWTSAHADGVVRDMEESLMLTGDGELVETQVAVYYTLANPRAYLMESAQPVETIRALAESAIRETVAEYRFNDLLMARREEFQRKARSAIQRRLDGLPELGVKLESVAILDLHPPQPLLDSYYGVTRALVEKERVETEAYRAKRTLIANTTVAAANSMAEAVVKFQDVIQKAKAERDLILSHVPVRRIERLNSFMFPTPLTPPSVAMSDAMLFAQHEDVRRMRDELARYRLYLETMEKLLAGRPKVIRDPAAKGTLHTIPELIRPNIRIAPPEPPTRGHGQGP